LSIEAATLSGAVLSILGGVNREVAKCGLHPLIHTLLKFNLPQDIESCQGSGSKDKRKAPTDQSS
jgi:hypothetical protein